MELSFLLFLFSHPKPPPLCGSAFCSIAILCRKKHKNTPQPLGFPARSGCGVSFLFFKNIFCRVHIPGLLHFLSSSDMPDPDSFCRSYFCYGTSIRSLKSTRAVLHTDPIPAELPLPVVLQQSLPAAFLPLPAFQRFLPPQLLWLAQVSASRSGQPLELG